MSQVFISYSRKNIEFARRLTDKLRMAGKDSWIDWEGIPLSSPNWWEDIKDGIEKSDNVVFIMSPDSMASIVCNMELDYALDLQKRVNVLVYQEVDKNAALASIAAATIDDSMKERLGGEFPLTKAHDNWVRISHINWLFFRESDDFDASFKKLLNAIDLNLDYVKAHTRYLERAIEWEEAGKRRDLLLFGDEIELAETWLEQAKNFIEQDRQRKPDTRVDVVNPLPQRIQFEYIQTSREEADKAAQYLNDLEISRVNSEAAAETARLEAQRAERARRGARHTLIVFGVLSVLFVTVGILFARTEFNNIQVSLELAKTEVGAYNAALTSVPPDLTLSAQQILDSQTRFDSLELASKAVSALTNDGNAETATLLSIRALNTRYTVAADSILIDALQQLRTQTVIDTQSPVTHVMYSPDWSSVLSASEDGIIYQWDAETTELLQVYEGYTGNVSALEFTATGDAILSSISNESGNEYVIRDIQTGKTLKIVENVSDEFIKFFAIDGVDYAITQLGDTLSLHNVDTDRVVSTYEAPDGNITSIDISPDRKFIAVGHDDGIVNLRSIETGEVLSTLEHDGDSINGVAFNQQGNEILVALGSGSITSWDIKSNKIMGGLNLDNTRITRITNSDDGQMIVAGTADGTIFLLNLDGNFITSFKGHTGAITSIDFSEDGNTVISGSTDGTIRFWNIDAEDRLYIANNDESPIQSIDFSPDGRTIVSGSMDNALRLWDVETRALIHEFEGHESSITSVSFSPDGSMVLSGSVDGHVYLWDTETAELLRVFEGLADIVDVDFNPDGTMVIGSGGDGTVRVWDVKTRRTLHTGTLEDSSISSIMPLGRDGTTVLTGDDDGSIYRWDVSTGNKELVFDGHDMAITGVALSPQGTFGLSGSSDGTVRVWDIATGETKRIFDTDKDPIHAIAFSPDGSMVAVGRGGTSQNGNIIRIWDSETGEVLREINGHDDMVLSVTFSPDGRFIASGSADGTIGVWYTDYRDFVAYACQQLNRDLNEEEVTRYELRVTEPTCN